MKSSQQKKLYHSNYLAHQLEQSGQMDVSGVESPSSPLYCPGEEDLPPDSEAPPSYAEALGLAVTTPASPLQEASDRVNDRQEQGTASSRGGGSEGEETPEDMVAEGEQASGIGNRSGMENPAFRLL